MGYKLKSNVYFCLSGEDIVFLDLNRGRYQMVSGTTAAAIQIFMTSPNVRNAAQAALDKLVLEGLLLKSEPSDDASLQPVKHKLPVSSFFCGRPRPFKETAVLNAVCAQIQVGQALRRANLLSNIDKFRHDRGPNIEKPRSDSTLFEDASAAFFYSRRLLPCHNKCLRTAIAMVKYLARRGLPAQLVIGVKKGPFGVHAWAQTDTTALSDTLDNILPYTPIFAS